MKTKTHTNHTNKLSGGGTPEFQPLPQRGHDSIFGLSRSAYYQLEKTGAIRLVRVRQPGKIMGRVLIDCHSVREYFHKLTKQQGGKHRPRPADETAVGIESGVAE